MINIILYRPEKPSNVGNIIRTCASTDTKLIIIGPLSFNLTGYYSARIDEKNRLVYAVTSDDDILVLSCKGHYKDLKSL